MTATRRDPCRDEPLAAVRTRRRMMRRGAPAVLLVLAAFAAPVPSAAQTSPRRPLAFEENRGQADSRVRYVSRARDYTVALTDDEAFLLVRKAGSPRGRSPLQAVDAALVRMRLVGGARTPRITAHDPLPGKIYHAGAGASGPPAPIDTFARTEYDEVYPGIDLVYYGDGRRLEFDFVVAPLADPDRIAFSLDGADAVTVTDTGDLSMRVGGTEVTLAKPLVYQDREDGRVEIPGAYLLAAADPQIVRLRLGRYDPSLPLVIDPAWTTVFGSMDDDWLSGLAVDSAGQPRVLGLTLDPNTLFASQRQPGGVSPPNCFLKKVDAATGLDVYTILFEDATACRTLALSPNDIAYFTGFVSPNGFVNDRGTTVVVVDDRSGAPVVSAFAAGNYDSSAVGRGVDALAVNSLEHVFLLGPCRLVAPGAPALELNGYNETADPAHDAFAEGCVLPDVSLSETSQPVLTVVDSSGAFLYGSFLSPGEFSTYGLAADDADRAYIVGAQAVGVSTTPDAYRAVCPANGVRAFDACSYLMVLETTTTGSGSLVYASYLWNTDNVTKVAVRLAPTGGVYIAGDGQVFDDFPGNRPTDPFSWPYSVYPDSREGVQLALFGVDPNGTPNQFEFALLFDPSRGVAALAGLTVRDAFADLRLFPSGAPAVASIAYPSNLDPLGVVTTFSPDADRVGAVWTQNLGPLTPAAFEVGTDSSGGLFLAGQVDRLGAQDSDIFVDRIDAIDPGANQQPFASALALSGDPVLASSPAGALVTLYGGLSWDPDGDPLTYVWTEGATPLGEGEFVQAFLSPGVHAVTLTVDDGRGGTNSQTITVSVVANTPAGGSASVTPPDSAWANFGIYNQFPVTVHFSNVVSAGFTSVTSRFAMPPVPPPGMQFGSPPLHFDLATLAGFSGPVDVCIDYRGMSFSRPDVDLQIYQQVNGVWVALPQTNDTASRSVCGTTSTLGTFAVFTPASAANEISILAGKPVRTSSCTFTSGLDPNDGGLPTDSDLCTTRGLAYDAARNYLYFAESGGGDKIRRVDLSTNRIATVAGTGIFTGTLDGPGGDPRDDDKNDVDPLNQVLSLALDAAGNLYVAEYGAGRIRKIDFAQNRIVTIVDVSSVSHPSTLVMDGAGALLFAGFADSDRRIWRLSPGADGVLGTADDVRQAVAGNGDNSFDPSLVPASGADPRQIAVTADGLAIGPDGSLYATGWSGVAFALRIAPGPDGLVDGVDDTAFVVAGNPSSFDPILGDGNAATSARLFTPASLAVAPNGDVYLGDTGHFQAATVRRIRAVGGLVTGEPDEIISTVAGFHVFDPTVHMGTDLPFSDGDGHALSSIFGAAFDLLVLPDGDLLVNDFHQIRRIGPRNGNGSGDITAPVLTLPASMTVEASSPAGAVATFSATAIDDVDGSVPAACSPASGSTFPFNGIGPTSATVTCSATDAAGNTATGSFTIVVEDTAPPVVTPPPSIAVAATEAAGARGNVPQAPDTPLLLAFTIAGAAADVVDPQPIRLSPQRIACGNPSMVLGPITDTTLFALGPNCVDFQFRDGSGNVGHALGTLQVSPPVGGHVNTAGVPVTATNTSNQPQPVTTTFAVLDQPGLVTATPVTPPVALPPGFSSLGPSFEIRTTALAPPAVVVCLQVSGVQAGDRLLELENATWVDRTASVDTGASQICSLPTSLGVFTTVRSVVVDITVTESIVVTDTPALLAPAVIDIIEQIVVDDAFGVRASAMIDVTEHIVVSDEPRAEPPSIAPLVLTLAPASATSLVGEPHTVMALVSDGSVEEARVVLTTTLGGPVRVRFTDPAAANSALSVSVSGTDVSVTLATNAAGMLTSTAAQVAAALNASPSAAAVLMAQVWPGAAGTGIVQPRPLTALSRVPFAITGTVTLAPSCVTSVPGVCAITYSSAAAGTDAIGAYLDVNGSGEQDSGEPSATAEQIWTAASSFRITGSGFNFPETPAYRATFDVTAGSVWSPLDSVRYSYSRTRMNFASTGIDSVSIAGTVVTITGTGSVNGGATVYRFTAVAADGAPDAFALEIRRPDGTVFYSAASLALAGGALTLQP